jgi:hypothetical protein
VKQYPIWRWVAKTPPFFTKYANARIVIDLGSHGDRPATPPPVGP